MCCAFGPGSIASRGLLFGAETASRNWRSEWDKLSGRASGGKRVPEFGSRMGCRFRLSVWRKVHPRIWLQNGTRFPKQPSSGKCVPESALGMGCAFRQPVVWKVHPSLSVYSGMRFPLKDSTGKCVPVWWAGGHKLSGLYSSTSLSHVGSAVWRMPAVCSFFASTPAERTSFMVKRMSGWP